MTAHDKKWYLKEMIRLNAFSTSASGLALEMGYKGKNQIYRILKDAAGEGSVEAAWVRLLVAYDLTEEELCQYVNAIGAAKDLWHEVQDQAAPMGLDAHDLAEQILHALLSYDEEGMRRVLSQADWEALLDHSREHPFQYAHLIVLYYIHYNNKAKAYKGTIAEEGTALMTELYQHMQALQPENRMLKEIADGYLSELSQMTYPGNLWLNTIRTAYLVQTFTDPNFRLNSLSMLRLLPVPDESLWVSYESLHRDDNSAYIFLEVKPEGATGGRYDCIEVEASLSDTDFVPKRCFCFWMEKPKPGEKQSLAYLSFRDADGQRQMLHYLYKYDAERQVLSLEPLEKSETTEPIGQKTNVTTDTEKSIDQETEVTTVTDVRTGDNTPQCEAFPFPTELHWVNEKEPKVAEERDWIIWFRNFMAENDEKIYIEMMRTEGVEILEEYEIVDVSISRKYLTVTIAYGPDKKDFRTELEKHPGLELIVPKMDAYVFRHQDDKELYIEWISPHVSIPVSAFTEVE